MGFLQRAKLWPDAHIFRVAYEALIANFQEMDVKKNMKSWNPRLRPRFLPNGVRSPGCPGGDGRLPAGPAAGAEAAVLADADGRAAAAAAAAAAGRRRATQQQAEGALAEVLADLRREGGHQTYHAAGQICAALTRWTVINILLLCTVFIENLHGIHGLLSKFRGLFSIPSLPEYSFSIRNRMLVMCPNQSISHLWPSDCHKCLSN